MPLNLRRKKLTTNYAIKIATDLNNQARELLDKEINTEYFNNKSRRSFSVRASQYFHEYKINTSCTYGNIIPTTCPWRCQNKLNNLCIYNNKDISELSNKYINFHHIFLHVTKNRC